MHNGLSNRRADWSHELVVCRNIAASIERATVDIGVAAQTLLELGPDRKQLSQGSLINFLRSLLASMKDNITVCRYSSSRTVLTSSADCAGPKSQERIFGILFENFGEN